MATLSKANTNGSISIIIPKPILDVLGWKCGEECKFSLLDTDTLVIKKCTENREGK